MAGRPSPLASVEDAEAEDVKAVSEAELGTLLALMPELNPALSEMTSEPLISQNTPLGAVVLRSQATGLELIAVPEEGSLKLDMRGVERLAFIKECTAAGRASGSLCACMFTLMRARAMVPERSLTASMLRVIGERAALSDESAGADALTQRRYDARELIASILLGAVAGALAPIALKG